MLDRDRRKIGGTLVVSRKSTLLDACKSHHLFFRAQRESFENFAVGANSRGNGESDSCDANSGGVSSTHEVGESAFALGQIAHDVVS